jgi:hypothetical protein
VLQMEQSKDAALLNQFAILQGRYENVNHRVVYLLLRWNLVHILHSELHELK